MACIVTDVKAYGQMSSNAWRYGRTLAASGQDWRPTVDSIDKQTALEPQQLLKVAEAARYLSISRSTLYELMDRGLLPYAKLGRARRIPRQSLIDLVARETRGLR